VPIEIATTVSLLAGARRVDFDVEFTNSARDHRLRMAFPTGCRTATVRAASPFDLVERPARFRERPDYVQPPVPTKHCDGLVTASARGFGAAVFTEGLEEYESAVEGGRVTFYLTLLRAFGWLSRNKMVTRKDHAGPGLETPEGQALRPHRLRLAFRPHGGAADEPGLVSERDDFLTGAVAMAVPQHSARLPAKCGWAELSPAGLALTAIKRAEERESLIVRFFNPGRRPVRARMDLGFAVAAAYLARLDETRLRKISLSSGGRAVECRCGAKEIVTLEIVPVRSGPRD
jgi:alpha-mannosidase